MKPESLRDRLRSVKILYELYGVLKYLSLRLRAGYHGLNDRLTYKGNGLPIPPPMLRYRVHGSIDRFSFLKVGEQCAKDISAAIASQGLRMGQFGKVLDFGCGCGRVIRHFLKEGEPGRFTGTDIDPDSIAWCSANVLAVEWKVNQPMPPTSFPDGGFDFIYVISVFTHLDEDYQNAWLKELARITKPGGHLLLTIHGRHVYGTLPPEDQAAIGTKGFLFKVGRTGRLKLDGLPDFYQGAYHSPEYIQREWSRYFKVLGHLERGINNHQDAILLRKE